MSMFHEILNNNKLEITRNNKFYFEYFKYNGNKKKTFFTGGRIRERDGYAGGWNSTTYFFLCALIILLHRNAGRMMNICKSLIIFG